MKYFFICALIAGCCCPFVFSNEEALKVDPLDADLEKRNVDVKETRSYGPSYGYANYSYVSPWSTLPGSYPKSIHSGPMYYYGRHLNPKSIYSSYLTSGYYHSYSAKCSKSYGQPAKLSKKDLDAAFAYALQELYKYEALEKQHYKGGNYVNGSVYSTGYQQYGHSSHHDPMYHKEREALFMEYASKYLVQYNCLSKVDAALFLPAVKLITKVPYGDQSCQYQYAPYGAKKDDLHCSKHFYSKYRTIDGSCNNWKHPYWGKAYVCHLRLVPSAYDDGISMPRIYGYSGKYLPGARIVSTVAHTDVHERAYYTNLKVAWGQYINHDLTNTPTAQAEYNGLLQCCPNSYHPQCFPIKVPAYGDYQSKYKRTCMNFVRSASCPLCSLGPRQQINIGTSFLDNEQSYGSSYEVMSRLRSYKLGYLKVSKDAYGKDILPITDKPYHGQCHVAYKGMPCFDSGDSRVNQHPILQIIHLLFVRRHNHHAKQLYIVNPKWDDEYLFQEARRITIAELQLITYNEYLPIFFGPTLMKYYNLDVMGPGYSYYEPYTDPTSWNEFAASAGRFGHSQISGFHSLVGGYAQYNTTKGFWLRDWYFDPALIHHGQTDAVIKGLLYDKAYTVDPWLVEDIKNYLFKKKTEKYGYDLPAYNIQRGRDHGLAPYHVYLDYCFGFKAYSWEDLGKFIPYEQLKILKSLYYDWRDVDFWSAGVSEWKFPDAVVGPTFACVLGIQYYHAKHGDRYFVTHGGQYGSFNHAQLQNLRKVVKLSNFICKTSDYLQHVQKHAFFPVASYNPLVPCKSLPDIDYNLWKQAY